MLCKDGSVYDVRRDRKSPDRYVRQSMVVTHETILPGEDRGNHHSVEWQNGLCVLLVGAEMISKFCTMLTYSAENNSIHENGVWPCENDQGWPGDVEKHE